MTLKERIDADFILAFKDKENGRAKKNILGVIKGEIQSEASRNVKYPSEEDLVMTILKRLEKSLKATNSPDALAELEIIKDYLPVMKTEAEIIALVEAYKEAGITKMGQLMGKINEDYKWQIDNNIVTKVAPKILNA